jgi:hypothetical protein
VNPVTLDPGEQEELYVVLKPRENELSRVLGGVLRRIEQELFKRMTIEEMERLASRFSGDR